MTGGPASREGAGEPFTLAGRDLPAFLRRRFVVLASGEALASAPEDWAGELLVLEHGRIELEDDGGQRITLDERAVFALQGTGVRVIRNAGEGRAVLAVVGRPPG